MLLKATSFSISLLKPLGKHLGLPEPAGEAGSLRTPWAVPNPPHTECSPGPCVCDLSVPFSPAGPTGNGYPQKGAEKLTKGLARAGVREPKHDGGPGPRRAGAGSAPGPHLGAQTVQRRPLSGTWPQPEVPEPQVPEPQAPSQKPGIKPHLPERPLQPQTVTVTSLSPCPDLGVPLACSAPHSPPHPWVFQDGGVSTVHPKCPDRAWLARKPHCPPPAALCSAHLSPAGLWVGGPSGTEATHHLGVLGSSCLCRSSPSLPEPGPPPASALPAPSPPPPLR